MKTFKQLVLAFLVLLSGTGYAQNSENLFEDFLRGGTDDANVLLNQYMAPGLKGLGYAVNSAWYNTAKPHETFGFDITISYVNAIVPTEDQSFEFVPSDYEFTRLASGSSTTLPTIMGGLSNSTLENWVDQQLIDPQLPSQDILLGTYPAPDGAAETIDAATITKEPALPVPIIQAGIGIIKGTEIKIRWLPNIDRDGFAFKYFGLGGLHSISQWLPVFKNIPVDISAFIGWTTISAEYDIPSGNIAGEGQRATSDINTFTYQLIASAHVSVISAYVGLGMDNFKTTFNMLGEYDIYPGLIEPLVNPISIEQTGNSGFRTSFGARLKLAIVTLSADYTLREYNTVTLALGFSVR